MVEWEWEGKREGQDEAGLRWSQIPNAWQCADPSPIIHLRLHRAVSCSAAVLRWRVLLASHDSAGGRHVCWRAPSCQRARTISPCVTPTGHRRIARASKIAIAAPGLVE